MKSKQTKIEVGGTFTYNGSLIEIKSIERGFVVYLVISKKHPLGLLHRVTMYGFIEAVSLGVFIPKDKPVEVIVVECGDED